MALITASDLNQLPSVHYVKKGGSIVRIRDKKSTPASNGGGKAGEFAVLSLGRLDQYFIPPLLRAHGAGQSRRLTALPYGTPCLADARRRDLFRQKAPPLG